jgi:hypothetical protein
MSLTNEADGSVVRGIMEQGKFREIPVEKITTPKGTFAMQSPTNAVPVMLPDGSVAQNYTSEAAFDMGSGGMGQYGQTNAASPQPATTSPSPSPTPQQAPAQFNSADEVKAAFRAGAITREQAVGILANQFGVK